MNKKPLISVSTPCWNSVKTIERTIKSVLQQDFDDYEYIIVDGGSTDGTLDIIKKYEPLFNGRMRWYSEPDKGIYDAFNKGAKYSVGKYCWNVNSDDFLETGALKQIAIFISQQPHDDGVIIASMNIVDSVGRIHKKSECSKKATDMIYKNDWMIPHPSTLVAKSIYEKYGYYDDRFKICGDMDWFHRIYPLGVNFYFTDIVITNFAIGGISTNIKYKREAKDRWLFFRKKYGIGFKSLFKFFMWHNLFFKNLILQSFNKTRQSSDISIT